MLTSRQVEEIAAQAALKALSASSFLRALSADTTDSEGRDAVLVTLVVQDISERPLSGDSALNTIVGIHHDLERAGEDRTVIIDFATEHDLATDGDPQS